VAKVSVVIPTHNRPELLNRAIGSVLTQTTDDFEVLVIDDASADSAAEQVVQRRNDRRIEYIRLEDSHGPAGARNAGLLRATAPYIAFLDDDDEWVPEKLQIQTRLLDRMASNVGGIYTARFTVDSGSGTTTLTRFPAPFDPAKYGNVVTASSVLLRHACFDIVGLFDEELFGMEDFDMWVRVHDVFRLEYLDEPLVKYYVHQNTVSQKHSRIARTLDRFLRKHRRLLIRNRRRYCLLHVSLGRVYMLAGETKRAREAFLAAIRLWPLEPRAYSKLASSFLCEKLRSYA
jgi:glycosyltransferase involved in cell wall biosynthesis